MLKVVHCLLKQTVGIKLTVSLSHKKHAIVCSICYLSYVLAGRYPTDHCRWINKQLFRVDQFFR